MLISKLKKEDGAALIFLILAVLIIVMLVLILVPSYFEKKEETAQEIDSMHEQTAIDSGKIQYVAGNYFYAIYDYSNKTFVKGISGKQVVPYGESKEHEGKVIYVKISKKGNVTVTWDIPREVPDDFSE